MRKITLLLVCDEYLYRHNGKIYFKDQEWKEFFDRYLRVFDNLRLVTRCVDEDELLSKRVILDNNKIEYIPLPEYHGPVQYCKKFKSIKKTIDNILNGCQVALFRFPFPVGEIICKEAIQRKIPYAIELTACARDFSKVESKFIDRLIWTYLHIRISLLCNHANGIAYVTKKYLQNFYKSQRVDAFYANYSSLALDKGFWSEPRKYPKSGEFKILHVSNNIRRNGGKGHEELISAIKLLKSEKIKVKVTFVGSSYYDGIERLKSYAFKEGVLEQISFVGFLKRQEIEEAYNSHDIFVLPTKTEGLPRVVIEAMAKGMPCIATTVGGIPELLNRDCLVDFSDVQDLKEKMRQMIISKEFYEKTSEENFNNSKDYYPEYLQRLRDEFYKKLKTLAI